MLSGSSALEPSLDSLVRIFMRSFSFEGKETTLFGIILQTLQLLTLSEVHFGALKKKLQSVPSFYSQYASNLLTYVIIIYKTENNCSNMPLVVVGGGCLGSLLPDDSPHHFDHPSNDLFARTPLPTKCFPFLRTSRNANGTEVRYPTLDGFVRRWARFRVGQVQYEVETLARFMVVDSLCDTNLWHNKRGVNIRL